MDLSALTWRKSSYSSGSTDNCVEVTAHRSAIAVRDSKDPEGPALLLDAGTFRSLTTRIKRGEHSR